MKVKVGIPVRSKCFMSSWWWRGVRILERQTDTARDHPTPNSVLPYVGAALGAKGSLGVVSSWTTYWNLWQNKTVCCDYCPWMNFMSCRFMSFHVMSCHFMSFHVVSCHVHFIHVMSMYKKVNFQDNNLNHFWVHSLRYPTPQKKKKNLKFWQGHPWCHNQPPPTNQHTPKMLTKSLQPNNPTSSTTPNPPWVSLTNLRFFWPPVPRDHQVNGWRKFSKAKLSAGCWGRRGLKDNTQFKKKKTSPKFYPYFVWLILLMIDCWSYYSPKLINHPIWVDSFWNNDDL